MADLLNAVRDTPWDFQIGDPTVMGWLTVALYFACALLCAGTARRAADDRASAVFWWALALTMLLLGVNKQLDLQSWFTAVGRHMAQSQGWYGERRHVQSLFIAGLIVLGGGVGLAVLYLGRRVFQRNLAALAGLLFLAVFIVARAASFHHVDAFLGFRVLGLRMNWILEIGGILFIGAAARVSLARRDPRPRGRDSQWAWDGQKWKKARGSR